MRCPHCAAAIPDGAAYCGVCGRSVLPGERASRELAPENPPDESGGDASMSLFELPVARSARVARVVVVLALDVVLAGAGIAMGLSWWNSRHAAAAPPAKPPDPPALVT